MNKFLNNRVKAEQRNIKRQKSSLYKRETEFLNMCASCWNALDEARRKMRRSLMYSYGDQWGDYVKDPDTRQWITEGDLIKKNGR